jgi:hypothetical protein
MKQIPDLDCRARRAADILYIDESPTHHDQFSSGFILLALGDQAKA